MKSCKNTWWYLFCMTCIKFSLEDRSVYLGENDFSMNIKCSDKILSRNIHTFYSLDRFAFFALKTKICCRNYWQNKVSSHYQQIQIMIFHRVRHFCRNHESWFFNSPNLGTFWQITNFPVLLNFRGSQYQSNNWFFSQTAQKTNC